MAKKDLMELMSKSESEEPLGQEEMSASAENGPVGAPMSTPQPNDGDKMESTAKVALAMKLLEQALLPFGSETKEGGAILAAVTKLQRAFGVKIEEGDRLIPAELKMMMEVVGTETPEMQAANTPPAPMLKAA